MSFVRAPSNWWFQMGTELKNDTPIRRCGLHLPGHIWEEMSGASVNPVKSKVAGSHESPWVVVRVQCSVTKRNQPQKYLFERHRILNLLFKGQSRACVSNQLREKKQWQTRAARKPGARHRAPCMHNPVLSGDAGRSESHPVTCDSRGIAPHLSDKLPAFLHSAISLEKDSRTRLEFPCKTNMRPGPKLEKRVSSHSIKTVKPNHRLTKPIDGQKLAHSPIKPDSLLNRTPSSTLEIYRYIYITYIQQGSSIPVRLL